MAQQLIYGKEFVEDFAAQTAVPLPPPNYARLYYNGTALVCFDSAGNQLIGTGTGGVTSVTGTANQIVVTGTITPVLSLASAISGITSIALTDTAANTDLSLTNTTAATSGTNQGSPTQSFAGKSWNGSASVADNWTISQAWGLGTAGGTGTNAISTLLISHPAGSTNSRNCVVFPAGPSISFNNVGQSMQLGSSFSNSIDMYNGATRVLSFSQAATTVSSGYFIQWNSAASGFAGSNDTSVGRAAAGVVAIGAGSSVTDVGGFFNWGGQKRVSTQFDKTSDATLGNVTGLSVAVAAGRTYTFSAVLHVNQLAVGGSQFAIGGTATATAIIYAGVNTVASTGAIVTPTTSNRATALAGVICDSVTGSTLYVTISGTITVNAAGTLVPQFAQKVSNGTASSVLVGSTFTVFDCP